MKMSEYFGANVDFADKAELVIRVKALVLAEQLSSGERDTLRAAHKAGLLESGETPSKGGRGELLQKKILCQTCHEGSDYSFSVTFPLGHNVVRALRALAANSDD